MSGEDDVRRGGGELPPPSESPAWITTGCRYDFGATLEENKHVSTDAGKKAYKVQTYNEQGAIWSSIQQGRSDVVMSAINGLRYAVAQQPGLRFLNEYHRLDVGFADRGRDVRQDPQEVGHDGLGDREVPDLAAGAEG